MSHTKGPWKLSGGQSHHIVDADANIEIAKALSSQSYLGPKSKAESMANARLIAAAPEMLEALETCLNFISNKDAETAIFRQEIRNIIKKARGD
jgi:hypothetical protein